MHNWTRHLAQATLEGGRGSSVHFVNLPLLKAPTCWSLKALFKALNKGFNAVVSLIHQLFMEPF